MYIKIPFDILDKMPIRDRKYYIHKFNEYMEAKQRALDGNKSTTTNDISPYTDMSQGLSDDDLEELEEMFSYIKKRHSVGN